MLVEAHGGLCGAIQLTMGEISRGCMQHAASTAIAAGIGNYQGTEPPEIFAATIENLNAQLKSIFDPSLNIKLLKDTTGKASFAELIADGDCLILGVFVDYEIRQAANGSAGLVKRLTFFDSAETYQGFVRGKISLYLEAQKRGH